MMPEWIGTFWFLGAVYLWFYFGQKIIDPWPNRTLLVVFPVQMAGIWALTGVVTWMFL